MAVYFFDRSGIVKRYVQEAGTAWVMAVTNPAAGNRIYLARIAGVEVISITATLVENAMMLAERYTLRGYDAVQSQLIEKEGGCPVF